MNPQQWESIGEIFEQVVVLPTLHRAAVLDRAILTDVGTLKSPRCWPVTALPAAFSRIG